MTDMQLEREPVPSDKPQDQIIAALVAAWGELPAVQKDRFNDITKSNYATLDSVIATIKPTLSEHGLMPTQRILTHADHVAVETTLYHKSGQSMAFPPVNMPVVGKRLKGGGGEYGGDLGPQEYGSAITYARRYSLLAALGISTGDDDDGNASQRPSQHKSAHTKPSPPKKGSNLKADLKAKPPAALGEDGAKKLEEYAADMGVSIDEIREYLATLGANHAKECEKPVSQWPVGWRGTINTYLKEHSKQGAES